jgi:hypothetical protein
MRYITFFLLILFVAFVTWVFIRALKHSDANFDRWKNIAQVLGVAFAGLFFLVKAADGWESTNMNINLTTKRVVQENGADLIAVEVELEKGEYGGVQLYGGEIRAVDPDSGEVILQSQKLLGTERLSYDGMRTDWDKEANHKYRITPNEKLHFGGVLKAPHEKVCIVQVVVNGYPDLWLPFRSYSQWRASTVSVPTKEG